MRFILKQTSRNMLLLVALIIIIITAIILFLGYQFEKSSTDLRKDELKRIVSLGLSSIDEYRTAYAEGRLEKDEALKLITDQVRKLTYEDKIQPNYLFMSSYDGTMLVQPYEAALEGSNQLDLIDADGKYIIRELIRQAEKGPGYVTYSYYPPGSKTPSPKISYVEGLPEFECYIGTGIYSLDITQTKNFYFRQTALFLIILVSILIIGGVLVFTPLIKAVQYISACYLKIEEDPGLENLAINPALFRKGSDARHIVQQFSDMTLSLSEKNRNLLEAARERDQIMENALREKEILIREMNHRLKNNLQIVISLLNIQKEKSTSSELIESYNESISRMESISLIHQMLYQSETSSSISAEIYLEQLIHYLIHSFGLDGKVKLNLNLHKMDFSIEQAVNIGLLTNEIITNAAKYAVTGDPGGEIAVSFSETGGIHNLVFSDNGPGIPSELLTGKSPGLGLKLIRTLTAQLGGELKIENQGGTRISLTF